MQSCWQVYSYTLYKEGCADGDHHHRQEDRRRRKGELNRVDRSPSSTAGEGRGGGGGSSAEQPRDEIGS